MGLPVLPGLAGESKSYAERLFNFPNIGKLSKEDAYKALRDPALVAGVDYEEKALEKIYEMTHGYPYFLQIGLCKELCRIIFKNKVKQINLSGSHWLKF